jgi:FMN phosphatase YigB (HAD superfamily)
MKVVLFDLGKTLEDRDILLPGARETLQAVQAMRDSNGEAAALALVSDFDTPDNPEQIPLIQQRYYELLDKLSIRSFFEPVADRVTLSTEVGAFKPDEKIFRAVIEKIDEGLGFRDVIFVTENQEHVLEARLLGIRGVHFKGPEQNSGEVDRLLELVPLIQKFLGAPDNGGSRTRA